MAQLGTKKDLLELWLRGDIDYMPIPNPCPITLEDMGRYSKVYQEADRIIRKEARRIKQYGERDRELAGLQKVYILVPSEKKTC